MRVVSEFEIREVVEERNANCAAQGYDANHRDIELLRLKSFTIGRKLGDEEVLAPRFIERLGELISCMLPFVSTVPPSDAHILQLPP